MILLKCEACGGNELKKQGNVYECTFCGSKYILDTNENIINKNLTEDDIISKLVYANQLHEADKYGEELKILTECYEKDSSNSGILTKLGRCYRSLNYIDKAIEYYNMAIEINPNEAAAYSNIGTIHILRGDYDKALPYYEKGLPLFDKADFDYWIAYANYAVVIAKQGDPKRADEMIKEAELRGYKNGKILRQMAGIKKKGILSGLKSLFS